MFLIAFHGIRVASICLAAYWVMLFVGTHLPRISMPSFQHSDKLLHLGAFAGLAFLLAWAIPTSPKKPLRNVFIALFLAIAYAVVDELSQIPIPGRTADVLDVAADTVGALLGIGCYLPMRSAWNWYLNRKQRRYVIGPRIYSPRP